jgi:hypothetical protein
MVLVDANRRTRLIADDRQPGPYVPARHQAIEHIRIDFGKARGNAGRIALKEQYRAIDRIGQSAAKDELAARVGLPRQCQMRCPKLASAFDIVGRCLIEE